MKFAIGLIGLVMVAGCDLAQEDLAKCREYIPLAKNPWGWEVALGQCERAVLKAPESPSGLEAARMIPGIKKSLQEAIDQKAAQEAAQEVARKAAQAARLAELSRKVRPLWVRQSDGTFVDSFCQGKGLGAYAREYSGGTWQENQERARLDGCSAKFNLDESTEFCCPEGPKLVW